MVSIGKEGNAVFLVDRKRDSSNYADNHVIRNAGSTRIQNIFHNSIKVVGYEKGDLLGNRLIRFMNTINF